MTTPLLSSPVLVAKPQFFTPPTSTHYGFDWQDNKNNAWFCHDVIDSLWNIPEKSKIKINLFDKNPHKNAIPIILSVYKVYNIDIYSAMYGPVRIMYDFQKYQSKFPHRPDFYSKVNTFLIKTIFKDVINNLKEHNDQRSQIHSKKFYIDIDIL